MSELSLQYEPIREVAAGRNRFELDLHFHTFFFDFNFPFRPLTRIHRRVFAEQRQNRAELVLPGYDEFEDFVTGYLKIDERDVSVYFEHSLAFISFGSNDREDLSTHRRCFGGTDIVRRGLRSR